uniref:ORM1-like protein 3 n=1 Tax=Romanomermis culicivorax TaxID=13658 RepID=A0A915I7W6_ROMCU
MNVGVANSDENPNCSWLSSRGGWASYVCVLVVLHLCVFALPFIDRHWVFTVASLVHNLVMYVVLHTLKGAPWLTIDQGESRRLTHWEQIDYGQQFTSTKKFLTVIPVVLFLIASYASKYDFLQFLINVSTLVLVLLPKLPAFHKVRLFKINKY